MDLRFALTLLFGLLEAALQELVLVDLDILLFPRSFLFVLFALFQYFLEACGAHGHLLEIASLRRRWFRLLYFLPLRSTAAGRLLLAELHRELEAVRLAHGLVLRAPSVLGLSALAILLFLLL